MEDLRDIGQKALDSINRLGASDVGDLVLSIGQIVDELQDLPDRESLTPELRTLKLEHLRGLFRELAYGEEYEDVTPIATRSNDWELKVGASLSGWYQGAASGQLGISQYSIASGLYMSPPVTFTFETSNNPTESFYVDDSKGNVGIGTEPGIAPKIEMDAMPIIEKPFVPRWWKTQVAQTQLEEELTDDDIN